MSQLPIKEDEGLFVEYRGIQPKGSSQPLSQQSYSQTPIPPQNLHILSQEPKNKVSYDATDEDQMDSQDSQPLFDDIMEEDEVIENEEDIIEVVESPIILEEIEAGVNLPPPIIELHHSVKQSLACHESEPKQNVLVTQDSRPIPIILRHEQLHRFTTLVIQATNQADSSGTPIKLGQTGPCHHDDSLTFVELTAENIKSEATSPDTIELELPGQIELNKQTEVTIFINFRHATACYKQSGQASFKPHQHSAKSPVLIASFKLIDTRTKATSGELLVTLRVGKNVTREFAKLKEPQAQPSRRRSISVDPIVAKYAENDDVLTISISKRHPGEVAYWKETIGRLNQKQYQDCGDNIFATFE